MKRFFLFITSALVILSLVTPAYASTLEDPLVVDLLAGQHTDAGSIKVWDDGDSLYVLYETVDPWCLTETHLAVATSLDGIPQATGNAIPGKFPYKNTHKCSTSFLYTVPLNGSACELYVAAHAVVKKPGSTETAWGNGFDFPGNNWGTYFLYEVNGCNVTSTPTETETSTPTPPTPTETSTPTPPTPTETPSPTPPTPTETPPICQPTVVTADFSQVALGQSVEGMGVVAPGLNIDAKGTAVRILSGNQPIMWAAPNGGGGVWNGGLASGGGFSDAVAQQASQAHLYTFTFAPGTSVSNFSLHMLDFGDYNPSLATTHYVSMTAYNANGFVVGKQELGYTSSAEATPRSSNIYGDLWFSGDAISAQPGQPGNWTWNVSGNGIVKIVLEFGIGFDPYFGLDTLSFTTECP